MNQTKQRQIKTLHSEQPENERWSQVHQNKTRQSNIWGTLKHRRVVEHIKQTSKQTNEAEEGGGGQRTFSHPHC